MARAVHFIELNRIDGDKVYIHPEAVIAFAMSTGKLKGSDTTIPVLNVHLTNQVVYSVVGMTPEGLIIHMRQSGLGTAHIVPAP